MANEENTISVSRGEEDKGKIPILDCKGKFDFSFFPDCIKGSKWVTGAADPVVESGDIKDYYINTTTGEVFQKTDKCTWTHIGNMKGSQNAFSNVLVNGVTIKADSETDTVELAAGTNIELTADAVNEKVTIAVTGQVASAAQADSATSADSAVKLATAHTINGVAFDGSADITITAEANGGNAATAEKLATARTISITGDATGSVTFDGSTDITITAKADGGNSDTLNGKSASDIIAACSSYGVPAGAVQHFATQTVPDGWIEADGSAVSRTQYADLFTAIGITFGAGDGSTTFNIPDLRGEFVRGWDHDKGIDSGRIFGSEQDFSMQEFLIGDRTNLRPLKRSNYGQGFDDTGAASTTAKLYINEGTANVLPFGANFSTETRPRNVALLACIKY